MGTHVDFARSELERAGYFKPESAYGGMLGPAVMKMVELFAEEGHSGYSAMMALALFQKVASFEPLSPLTGEDDEWFEVTDGVFQNVRCPHVFKEDGAAYDSQGRVFRDPDGATFTNRDSRVPITFPYVPKVEIVERGQS